MTEDHVVRNGKKDIKSYYNFAEVTNEDIRMG